MRNFRKKKDSLDTFQTFSAHLPLLLELLRLRLDDREEPEDDDEDDDADEDDDDELEEDDEEDLLRLRFRLIFSLPEKKGAKQKCNYTIN